MDVGLLETIRGSWINLGTPDTGIAVRISDARALLEEREVPSRGTNLPHLLEKSPPNSTHQNVGRGFCGDYHVNFLYLDPLLKTDHLWLVTSETRLCSEHQRPRVLCCSKMSSAFEPVIA